MDLFIDLHKAQLNYAKLVKKPVQVKGKNGKVFTRMQWVSPDQASTGHGVRKIMSQQGYRDAVADGIDKHPQYHEALDDQRIGLQHDFDKHPHFFLPETKESVKNMQKRFDEVEKKHGMSGVIDAGKHAYSFGHKEKVPEHMHKIYEDPKPDYNLPEQLHPDIRRALNLSLDKDDYSKSQFLRRSSRLDNVTSELKRHWYILRSHVEQKIREDTDDETIKDIQLRALQDGDMNHNLVAAQHPAVAKAVVDHILGKDLADKFRRDIEKACLSINFPGKALDGIKKEGYKASQMMDFVERELGEEGVDKLNEVIDSHDDTASMLKAIRQLRRDTGDWSWGDVYDRAEAEWNAIGLRLPDPKPTYVALNPTNSPTGGTSYYGNRWLKVNEDALKYCTATFDDSFNTSKSVAKVFSMDHLKDMFILKQIHNEQDDDLDTWAIMSGDIPIELQYHKTSLSTDQFKVMPDPADIDYEDDSELDNDDLDPDDLDDTDFDLDIDDLDDLDLDDEDY